jgi:2-polyprenyl-3-methyl-5-hydroxy-6-metoxy-1,4-benzoquinol methylase
MTRKSRGQKQGEGFHLPSSGTLRTRRSESDEIIHTHKGEEVNCNLCGSNDFKRIHQARNYNVEFVVVRCRKCGLAYINPRMPASVIENMYSSRETINFGFAVSSCGPLSMNRQWHEARFEKMINHYKKINPSYSPEGTIRYLDVGCGIGQTLEFAKKRGWESHGIDISKFVVEEGKRQGRNILLTNLEDSPFEDGYFDILLMSEVIEHFTDPLRELNQARKKLKKGGLLVVDTINIDSFFMKFLGENSSFVEAGHLTYFNYRTLREMLKKAGFEVVKGYRGLELSLGDYLAIYSTVFRKRTVLGIEMGLSILRKIGWGDFCFGGIVYYAKK